MCSKIGKKLAIFTRMTKISFKGKRQFFAETGDHKPLAELQVFTALALEF
jgi:hypothetical protein